MSAFEFCAGTTLACFVFDKRWQLFCVGRMELANGFAVDSQSNVHPRGRLGCTLFWGVNPREFAIVGANFGVRYIGLYVTLSVRYFGSWLYLEGMKKLYSKLNIVWIKVKVISNELLFCGVQNKIWQLHYIISLPKKFTCFYCSKL
jgi:hypothetical protein